MNTGSWIGIGICAVSGVVIVTGIAIAVRTYLNSLSWKPVRATVVSATVDSSLDSDNARTYTSVYRLRYQVDGQNLESTVRSNIAISAGDVVQARVNRHPPGTVRDVFYNPAKPSQLGTGFGFSAYGLPFGFTLMGLLFLIVGSLILYGTQPPEW